MAPPSSGRGRIFSNVVHILSILFSFSKSDRLQGLCHRPFTSNQLPWPRGRQWSGVPSLASRPNDISSWVVQFNSTSCSSQIHESSRLFSTSLNFIVRTYLYWLQITLLVMSFLQKTSLQIGITDLGLNRSCFLPPRNIENALMHWQWYPPFLGQSPAFLVRAWAQKSLNGLLKRQD